MAKVIGNTTATPMAVADWSQTDKNKADYIKNKPTVLTETDIVGIIEENSEIFSSKQTPSDWSQTDAAQVDYIKNKPTILSPSEVVDIVEGVTFSVSSSVADGTLKIEQTGDICYVGIQDGVLVITGPSGKLPGYSNIDVDQDYSANSSNAQSGKAVTQAIEDAIGEIQVVLQAIVEGGDL